MEGSATLTMETSSSVMNAPPRQTAKARQRAASARDVGVVTLLVYQDGRPAGEWHPLDGVSAGLRIHVSPGREHQSGRVPACVDGSAEPKGWRRLLRGGQAP